MIEAISALFASLVLPITPLKVSLVVLHCIIVIVNISMLWAFFDRYRFIKKRERFENVCLMAKLFLSAMPGLFALPGVLGATKFPKYGFKLWFGELPAPGNPWLEWRAEEAARNLENNSYAYAGHPAVAGDKPGGRCISIWPKPKMRSPHDRSYPHPGMSLSARRYHTARFHS